MTLPPNASPTTVVRVANQVNRAALVQRAVSCVDGMPGDMAVPLLRAAGIRFGDQPVLTTTASSSVTF